MNSPLLASLLRTLLVMACLGVSARAATFTVTTTADELDVPAGANLSLREAVRDAASGDTIIFAAGLSGATITLTAAGGGEIVIGKNLTIDAGSLPAGVAIAAGTGRNRHFYVIAGQTVALNGLTLTGGEAHIGINTGFGGSIRNEGSLSLTRCTLAGNTTSNGGGLFNASTGTATVDACTFVGNTAGAAGGGISSQGVATVTRSTFSGNSAGSASNGGGAVNGVNFATTNVTLENCTIVGNSAMGATAIGGGVRRAGPDGSVTIKNCIVAGNTATTAGTENLGGTITQTGANITTGDPLLNPLGNYGGPTQTRPPLPGSPAIDTAVGSPFTTDQRGCPIFGVADIGAAESATLVTTGTDELDTPAGASISLREAVRDTPVGGAIVFAPALSGGACTLTTALGGEIVLSKSVTIDASSLPAGITLDGGAGTNRIFSVTGTTPSVSLRSLTLTGGNGEGASKGGGGGAIWTEGLLDLEGCTLHGNSAAVSGGAIHKTGGALSLSRCTLSGNSSANGGVLSNTDTLSITHCTLSGNTATNSGGGILQQSGTLTLTNSIVAGNTAPTGGDIRNSATVVYAGANVVQSYSGTAASGPPAINAAPLLAPLGNYGGSTQTRALLPGSPARNASIGSTITSDQRGFPLVGTPDIGAYEAGTFANYNAFIWESLPTAGNGTLTDPLHAATFDFDGDGVTNFNEWLALTSPTDSTSYLRVIQFTRTSPNVTVTFPSVLGRSYTFESSPDLVTWTPIAGAPVPGTGSDLVIQLGPFAGVTRLFIKVRTGP